MSAEVVGILAAMPAQPQPSCEMCGARPGERCQLAAGDCPTDVRSRPTAPADSPLEGRLVAMHRAGVVHTAIRPAAESGCRHGERGLDADYAKALVELIEAGWSLERVETHVIGLDVDRALAHIGAYPDRPVLQRN